MNEDQKKKAGAVAASSIGTVLEWYDFFTYGTAAALVFPKAFFPKTDQFASVLASLAVFGLGFFARPVGGFIFGHLGDRLGRKKCLVTTLTMMGCATLLIGLLPTYATIGVAAPTLLVLLRLLQGAALGGEYGAAVLFVTENVPTKQMGFFGSWTQAGVPAGMLLSTGVYAIAESMTGDANFGTIGWRIPFIVGGLVALTGVYVRMRLFETAEFAQTKPLKSPLKSVFVQNPREILGAILIRLPENASYYLVTVFLVSFGATHGSFDKPFLLRCLLIGSAIQFVTILLFGRLCDRFGMRKVLFLGMVLITPCFWLLANGIGSGDRNQVLVAFSVFLATGHALLYAPQSGFLTKLFPVQVRYSGISIVIQVSAVLAGGIAPFIGAYLTQGANLNNLILYVGCLAALGLLGLWVVGNKGDNVSP